MIWWLGGLSIAIPALFGVIAYHLVLQDRWSSRYQALHNLREIGRAMEEFEQDYGRYPDLSTGPEVKQRTGSLLTMGDSSSNQLFRQLIASSLIRERRFWAPLPGRYLADDVATRDSKALEYWENGFSYVAGLDSTRDAGTPLVFSPGRKGTNLFDLTTKFGDKAVILTVDGSAALRHINRSGEVIVNGHNIFDPAQTFWKGKAPDLKWHE